MRTVKFFLIFWLSCSLKVYSQNKNYTAAYYNHNSVVNNKDSIQYYNALLLNIDSTFVFDAYSVNSKNRYTIISKISTKGKWQIAKNNLYLKYENYFEDVRPKLSNRDSTFTLNNKRLIQYYFCSQFGMSGGAIINKFYLLRKTSVEGILYLDKLFNKWNANSIKKHTYFGLPLDGFQ